MDMLMTRLEKHRPLTQEQEQRLSSLLLSRTRRRPLQYLLGETWFYGRCFTEEIAPESYSFAEGTDPDTIRAQIRAEYNLKNQRDRESAYLTAKIYRGVFLPTAIYFRGEKIIDITL